MEARVQTVTFEEDGPEARSRISAAVDALIESQRENPRLRVVAAGDELSTATISALISALRKLREHGGALQLSAERDSVAAVIRLNGLDRVLAFPLGEGDDAVDRRSGTGRPSALAGTMRAAVAVLTLLTGVALWASPAGADDAAASNPAAILSRVIERNPNLSSYQSRLHVDVRLISFPFIGQHLDGSTYFKRPANYEVVFDHVPSYAKGFEKLYSDVGDPSNWQQRFVISYEGEAAFENRSDIVLHMVQRVRGMIDHETVLIDPAAWTIDQIRYDYYNGGVVTMTQHFSLVDGYSMLSSQHAEIKIPHVRAVANGTYTDYHTNVAIADSVFTKKN